MHALVPRERVNNSKKVDSAAELAALKAELALYRDAVGGMHQGLSVFDQDGRIALCNERYAEVVQLPRDKIHPGITIREMIELGIEAGHYAPELTAGEIEEKLWANLRDGSVTTLVRGGRTYTSRPCKTAGGLWVGTFEDVSAQVEAQSALRASETRLKAILNAMPDCVKMFDETGQLIDINPRGLELLQAPDLEALSTPGYMAIPPEYLDETIAVHRRVIAGESVVWNYEVIGMKGRRRHVEAHAVPFLMPDGSKMHLSITRDVEERQLAHEALRRSEERLRLVQESTGLADFEGTPGLITQISDAFIKQVGLPAGTRSLTLEEWTQIVHPDDRKVFAQNRMANVELDGTAQFEFRIIRPDNGEIRWIHSRTRLKTDADGKIFACIGAHLDITERKLAEEELQASESRLRLVQEATGLADFEAGPDGVARFSEQFVAQTGLPPGTTELPLEKWLQLVHPDDRGRLNDAIAHSLGQEESFDCEFRIVRADTGEIRWISSRTKMERDETGAAIRSIGAHLDITERKLAEEDLRASEGRLRLVQEATGLADFEVGSDGIAQLSERFVEQSGLPPGTREIAQEQWMRMIHPDDRDRLDRDMIRSGEQDEAFQCEFRIIRPDNGEVRWISSHTKMERDAAGLATRSIGAHLDITERKNADEALRESEERFRLAAEAAGLGVWDYDLTLDRRDWSGRLQEILGVSADVEPGMPAFVACIKPSDREEFRRTLREAHSSDVARIEATFRIVRASDGAERWVTLNTWRTHRADNSMRRIITTVRDVTEEKTAEERVRWTARHDALTLLPNRGMFQENLDLAIREAVSSGGAVGLLLLDLDDFKQINDSLGHDAGDKMLQMFAERLRGVVRAEDTVARFGGDEFAIVMPDIHTEQSVIQLSRAIQERLREPFVHEGRLLDCRVSMGASVFPMHGRNSEVLLKNADVALYAAKAGGRGMVSLFEPQMRDDVQRRISMVQLGRNAIRDDRVVPYYQPKVDLGTRAIVGFEALLRWRTASGRIGLPGSIEAAFEDLEVAAAISDRMIERVIADMRGWLDRGIEFHNVAVNAAAAEFRRDNFAERVLERLSAAQIPTRCFQLEVTETVFLGRGAEYVHRALALLNKRGVKIALDDFGTGYASLRHLKEFPVDIIKIDKGFVRDMAIEAGDDAIVNAVINLGRSLGIKVVAEGIETVAQKRRLIEMGCDFGQGFLFSRAIPANRVAGLLERWPTRPALLPKPGRNLRLVANRA